MKIPTTIPQVASRHSSEDYAFLREEGLKYIEQLASDLWTDYNTHDPGITLLEALCYAITDLGYRTGFDIKDILAREGEDPAAPDPPLFTARQILTVNPWTLLDWRSLLVDVEGVHNAWLFKADHQEVDFFADCKKSRLRYYGPDYQLPMKKGEKTLSDFLDQYIDAVDRPENEQILMPLELTYTDADLGIQRRLSLEVPLPGWTAVHAEIDRFLPFINLEAVTGIDLLRENYDNIAGTWEGDLRLRFTGKEGQAGSIDFNSLSLSGLPEPAMRDALVARLQTPGPEHPLLEYKSFLLRTLAREVEHDIRLRGLYEVLLEYEDDEQLGDLNGDLLSHTLFQTDDDGNTREIVLEAFFPSWRAIWPEIRQWHHFIDSPALDSVTIENAITLDDRSWEADLRIQYQGQGSAPDVLLPGVRISIISGNAVMSDVLPTLENDLQSRAQSSLPGRFHAKLKRLYATNRRVEQRLHDHRDLCEDFLSISNVCINEIALCADIEADPAADLVELQAQILYQVQNYLSPPVRFYTLREMTDRKIAAEEIFNGPPLNHGFIRQEELQASDLQDYRYVYVSDIINILMDIEGVRSVSNVLLTKYDKAGRPVLPSQRWCLRLDYRHMPQLTIPKSKLLFFKDGLPYFLERGSEQYEDMEARLSRLYSINDRSKLLQTELDWPRPQGRPLPLSDYTPLRMTFPETYGVGRAGLSETAAPARKAKAKQLKAYLIFFDQLLANYLGQLSHVKELFSLDPGIKKTYFAYFLDEEAVGADLFIDAGSLEDAAMKLGPGSLQRLVESEDVFRDRRNRFLDHLIARFAERFNEYALLMNTVSGIKDPDALVQDKIAFLEDYDLISAQRGRGFNYRDDSRVWDTENVPGLQKRAARLLGIADYSRRDLHCPSLRNGFILDDLGGGSWSFHLEEEGQDILLGLKIYSGEDPAFYAKEALIRLATDADHYETGPDGSQHRFYIGRRLGDGTLNRWMESDELFASSAAAETAAGELRKRLSADFGEEPCAVEGLHVVEHLLLRPRHEFEDDFFTVCLDEDCFFCGEEDPYSFRVTVILPYWMDRFIDRQMKFREYAERLLRREAPAHVHVKICWVDNVQMRRFEVHYRRWLEEQSKPFPDADKLTLRLNALLEVLGELRSVYPSGRLHDCDDQELENAIILNKSFLGEFDAADEEE